MSSKDIHSTGLIVTILAFLIVAAIATPAGRYIYRQREYAIQKADDAANYATRKEVEDSCRAMIASYESDKLTYEEYKDSESAEKRSWAEQAKMRANKTAATYNNYVLKNSFVWSGNVPADIRIQLDYITED